MTREVRVVQLSRNTGWGHDPQLSYELKEDERVLSATHGYASGNREWLTLIIEGPRAEAATE